METRNTWIALIAILMTGCIPCYALQIGHEDHAHRISREYIDTYGCSAFDGVNTIEDMIQWCVDMGLGDTVAADINYGCRPGESERGCELFWVCE